MHNFFFNIYPLKKKYTQHICLNKYNLSFKIILKITFYNLTKNIIQLKLKLINT